MHNTVVELETRVYEQEEELLRLRLLTHYQSLEIDEYISTLNRIIKQHDNGGDSLAKFSLQKFRRICSK